jgi:hypothetical protein
MNHSAVFSAVMRLNNRMHQKHEDPALAGPFVWSFRTRTLMPASFRSDQFQMQVPHRFYVQGFQDLASFVAGRPFRQIPYRLFFDDDRSAVNVNGDPPVTSSWFEIGLALLLVALS